MTLASQLVALAALWVSKLSLDAIRAHPRWSGAPSRASSSASGAVAWPGGCCRRGDHREPPSR
jgi:hypothetical protein